MDAEPIISIEATPRPIEWVELVGHRYRVRRPKSIVEAAPKRSIVRMAAYVQQEIQQANRATRRATSAADRIEMTADDLATCMQDVWRYLDVALVDPGDYEAIRRRLYGADLAANEAAAHTWISLDVDPSPDDPLDVDNIVILVGNLLAHWAPEAETVRSAVTPPQPPAAKKATTSKRPAQRPKR